MMRRAGLLVAVLLLAGCDRELRKLSKEPPPKAAGAAAQRQVDIQPGKPGRGVTETSASRTFDGDNAFEISQGKRLFRWYNCAGCHANGGGGMGPPLMDARWFYGHEPDKVYATIMDGRPNGMPAFRGRITDEHAWQLVAYVRSMSGLAAPAALPGRSDSIGAVEPELRRSRLEPSVTGPPPTPSPPAPAKTP